ncbi:hypothetical protein [Novosphingobium sp.]|uniref:hypothetical protein n=1 Tax=Novosphingobium sp. TaxID=1874826 RepID=UPI0025E136FA|nr:hypothetical protein [Novosphingobium sp.]
MKKIAFASLLVVALSGCITYQNRSDGITRLRIGESGSVDGPTVTPLAVLEDSRCPAEVQCLWAGRVKVSVRVELGTGSQTRDMVLGEEQSVADGSLTLVEVLPQKKKDQAIYPDEYRFGFKFAGGL